MKNYFLLLFLFFFTKFSIAQALFDSLKLVMPVGHTSSIEDFALTKDEKRLFTIGDKDIICWDIKTGKEIQRFYGHSDNIQSLCLSPNELKLATSSYDKTIKIWDTQTGNLITTLSSHEEYPDNVFFFHQNSDRLVSVCNFRGENEVIVWDLINGKTLFQFKGDIAIISNNDQILFVGNSDENIISSYSILTGQKINDYSGLTESDIRFNTKSIIYSLDLNSDNTKLLAAGGDGVPIVWDVNSSLQLLRLQGHKTRIFHAGFSPNDKYIYTSGEDDGLYELWNSETGDLFYEFEDSLGNIFCSSFSSDSRNVMIGSSTGISGKISLVNLTSLNKIETQANIQYDSKMKLTNNSKCIAVSVGESLNIYDFNTIKLVNEYKGKSLYCELNSFDFAQTKSSLDNFILIGSNFIYKINDITSLQLIMDTLLNISRDGYTAWALKDRHQIDEIDLPSRKTLHSFILPYDLDKNEFEKINLKYSINFLYVEIKDSIFVYNRNNQQLIQVLNGNSLALSNDDDLIGYLTDYKLNDINDLSQCKILIYKISSKDTLYYSEKADEFREIKFSKSSEHFLSLSFSGVYDGFAIVYYIQSRKIIDTIGYEISNAGFISTNNQIYYDEPTYWENRNYPETKIRNYINHDVQGSLKGDRFEYGWKENNFTTILNDSILIYRESDSIPAKILKGHTNGVTSILYNDDQNKLISSGRDNKIIVWNLKKSGELYNLLIFRNNNWLVKLPNSPYYMCSKNASKMLHYVTPSLKVIGFEQLDPIYNRPDIVLDSIGKYFGGADQELVANYRQSWEKRIDRLGLDKEKLGKGEIAVPSAEIIGADDIDYENKEGKLQIKVKANDPKYSLSGFNVFVNEVPLYGSAGISIAQLKKQVWDTTVSIPLSVGENKIQVSVMNELGLENFKYPTYVNYTPSHELAAKTYYIGIGVNEFKESNHNLKYCVKDVTDLAQSFGGFNTEVKLFTNQQVTKENILALKSLLNKTTVNDKVIISCSSHGLLDDSLNFYLAMHDVDFDNPKARGLKYEELENLLDGIPARRKLLLLDACNSGENDKTEVLKKDLAKAEKQKETSELAEYKNKTKGVIIQLEEENKNNFKKMNELFVNVRNNTGSVIISAAGGQESALEAITVDGKGIENGAFTYSILECLNQNKGKELKVNTLKQYAEKRVEEITNGKQKPTSRQETMEINWKINE